MSEALEIVQVSQHQTAAPSKQFFDLEPKAMMAKAGDIADCLMDLVEKKNLYVAVRGKKHLLYEAWITIGNFLGILPREREVKELADGSYEATIDLVNFKTGQTVGGASALCGIEERRWKDAERFARRSMAITRATSKAYRLSFSWIVVLAGYNATPADEMDVDVTPATKPKETLVFNKADPDHQSRLVKYLEREKHPYEWAEEVANHMHGMPITSLPNIVAQVKIENEVFSK